jgi:hypothetical protein
MSEPTITSDLTTTSSRAKKTPHQRLIACCKANQPRGIRRAIADGADPNERDAHGFAPLDYPCRHVDEDRADLAALLLELGADPNSVSSFGFGALGFACANPHLGCLTILLRSGVDIDAPVASFQTRAAMICARDDRIAALEMLIAAGADLELKDQNSLNASMIAIRNNQPKALGALLSRTADPDAKSAFRTSLAMMAAFHNSVECLAILDERGADLFAKDNNGHDAETLAMARGKKQASMWLAERKRSRQEREALVSATEGSDQSKGPAKAGPARI